jgi:hypothetical protein
MSSFWCAEVKINAEQNQYYRKECPLLMKWIIDSGELEAVRDMSERSLD